MRHFKTYQEFNESKKSRMMKSLIGKDKKKSQKDARKYDKKRREDEESPEDLELRAAGKMQKESVNENKHRYIDIKDLHFEMDPDVQDEMKLEIGTRTGGVTRKEKIDNADYDLKRFRKKIKYWDGNKRDEDFAVGVFAGPDHYNTIHSTLGGGPHAKIIKPKRWNQKLYDKWIEDMASGEGWKHSFDMAQNATHEPGLTAWVKKTYRERDPLQRIQWDIEALGESVNEAIGLPTVAVLAIGAALAARIGLMKDDKLQKLIDTTKQGAKTLAKELPIIGKKIKDKEFNTKQSAEIQKYLKDELTDQDITDILMYNPDINQSLVNIASGKGTYRLFYQVIRELGGAAEYGRANKKFLALRKKIADGEIKINAPTKKDFMNESLLNESLKSKYGSVYTDLQEDLTKPQQFYWAMHADLYDQLSKSKDANKEADTLSQSIKDGTRKEALQYFLDIILDGGVKKNQKIKA